MENFQITEAELWAFVSNTADTLTIQKVEKWMKSTSFDEVVFTEITAVYEATLAPKLTTDKATSKFFDTIAAKESPKRYPFKKLLRYAAILIIIVSATLTYQHIASTKGQLYVETTFGEQKQLELPDGSKVWLNASSKLSYHKKSPRTIYLEGEAFFDVAKDSVHPFTVSTFDHLKVRALGTSFNVKSYLNSTVTETKLFTGKVEVTSGKTMKKKRLLTPHEKAIFYRDKNELVKSKMDSNAATIAWKEGKIQFKNKVFRAIALDLKNQFNIKISFVNEQMANSKFTGSFANTTTISEILEVLSMSKPFNYKLNTETNEWIIE